MLSIANLHVFFHGLSIVSNMLAPPSCDHEPHWHLDTSLRILDRERH